MANEYFNKALVFCKTHGLDDEELIEILYYNYTFNLLRINPTTASWKGALNEFKSMIDMNKINSQIKLLNLHLEVLRQTDAPRAAIDELQNEALPLVSSGKYPIRNKIFFAANAPGIA